MSGTFERTGPLTLAAVFKELECDCVHPSQTVLERVNVKAFSWGQLLTAIQEEGDGNYYVYYYDGKPSVTRLTVTKEMVAVYKVSETGVLGFDE